VPERAWAGRLWYLLALLPAARAGLPRRGPSGLAADAVLAAVILGVVWQMRRARRLTERVDSLRRTMNEAVVHDLKNPMTSIMGCVSCALDDDMPVERRAKLLRLALHGCKTQMALLETLIDTNRLEHQELRARRETLGVKALLAECLDGVRGTATSLGVALQEEISPRFPGVLRADPDLLPRVIVNLLHNALKYTPPGGTVLLRASVEDSGPEVEIRDTGIGIAPQHIQRLFEKYYRVEGGDQMSRRGSGFGLYFCRLVIEAHGGAIQVSSGVGRGTSIRFTLPPPEEP
jgi:two-component system phosphate regulon sensor histidine kinase PhoR